MFRSVALTLTLCLATITAQASPVSGQGTWETTLQARDVDHNISGIEAYYDTDLDITWLANANLARTNTYGIGEITYSGAMPWNTTKTWLADMNYANYLGVSNWRLPTVTDTGLPGCGTPGYSGTDCGYNVDVSTGEMAHMFYSTLGNTSGFSPTRVQQPCVTAGGNYCLTNTGPFSNLNAVDYWSGTQYALLSTSAWDFDFYFGGQGPSTKSNTELAWAVVAGDPFAVVPIPPAVWLLGTGLAGLGGRRLLRRKISS